MNTLVDEDALFDFGFNRSEEDESQEESMDMDLSSRSMDLSGVEEPTTSTPTKSKTPTSRPTCDHCGNTYKTKYGFNIHSMKYTGRYKYVCVICNQEFSQTKQFKSHVASHNKLSVSSCNDCGKSFTGHSSLRRHMLVCGKNANSEFHCDLCAVDFKTKEYLRAHQREKHQEPRYMCENCGKAFVRRSYTCNLQCTKRNATD